MNWKQISEQYPKAWEEMIAYFCDVKGIDLLMDNADGSLYYTADGYVDFNDRLFFDFFDEEGIMIGIQIRTTSEPSFWFQMEINERGVATTPYSAGYFLTRTEAEQQAFAKAFEILEQRLI